MTKFPIERRRGWGDDLSEEKLKQKESLCGIKDMSD